MIRPCGLELVWSICCLGLPKRNLRKHFQNQLNQTAGNWDFLIVQNLFIRDHNSYRNYPFKSPTIS